MKNNNLLRLILLSLIGLFLPSFALAAAPSYTGAAFDQMQIVADDGALFFGVIVALAIVITGFFLGRRWLKKVG